MEPDYTLIWSHNLRNYVEEITGQEWDLHRSEDFPGQDSMIKVRLPEEEYSTEFGKDDPEYGFDIQRWIDGGNFYNNFGDFEGPRVGHILQWLYEEGVLPAGGYIVEVWW